MRGCQITILLISALMLATTGGAVAAVPKSKPKPKDAPSSQETYPGAFPGRWCVTGPRAIVTQTRYEGEEVLRIMASGDNVAYQKLFQERKALMLKPGLRVYVMEAEHLFARIRLEGQTEGGWVFHTDLEDCHRE